MECESVQVIDSQQRRYYLRLTLHFKLYCTHKLICDAQNSTTQNCSCYFVYKSIFYICFGLESHFLLMLRCCIIAGTAKQQNALLFRLINCSLASKHSNLHNIRSSFHMKWRHKFSLPKRIKYKNFILCVAWKTCLEKAIQCTADKLQCHAPYLLTQIGVWCVFIIRMERKGRTNSVHVW